MPDSIARNRPRDIVGEEALLRDTPGSLAPSAWPVLLRVAASATDGSPLDAGRLPGETDGWTALAAEAEAHGLVPLAHACLGPHRVRIPEATMQQLDALVLRNRVWHRERMVALSEILEALRQASIDTIVLKGAALAWTIYPSPAMRP